MVEMNGVGNAKDYDNKVQAILEQCRISQKLLNYTEHFNYPYVSEVTYYEQLLKIGQGTFGEVFKARCKRTGRLVALKKILMENEKEGFPITALREIKMLQRLRHQHITELVEVCTSKQKSSGKEKFCFYLVFTFCEHDLAGLLSNSQVKIRLVDIKTMMQHILRGLHKIHSSQILHRDMKAANVLITGDGVLKLADFGLARLMYKQSEHCYTNRVVTLWYRPPELLLGTRNYGPSIDIWGAGCIMAELWIRAPILQGNTEQSQLELISKLCGSINPHSWPGCDKLPYYNNLQGSLQQNLPRRVRERINPFLQVWWGRQAPVGKFWYNQYDNNEQALSLIDLMLTLNPEKRPTASAALDHNFFFETPIPLTNIQELLLQLKGTNLFEYTSGCGAHANRRRPVAPAAPMQQQQTRGNNNFRPGHPQQYAATQRQHHATATNLFDYTSGSGAQGNARRRTVVPAAASVQQHQQQQPQRSAVQQQQNQRPAVQQQQQRPVSLMPQQQQRPTAPISASMTQQQQQRPTVPVSASMTQQQQQLRGNNNNNMFRLAHPQQFGTTQQRHPIRGPRPSQNQRPPLPKFYKREF